MYATLFPQYQMLWATAVARMTAATALYQFNLVTIPQRSLAISMIDG